jgi:citrate lyase synthetase
MAIGVNLPSRYNTIKSLVPEHYMKYLYKKLSSPKGIVYNKKYRLKIVSSSDAKQLIVNKPTKVLGQFVPDTANPKWILQTLK